MFTRPSRRPHTTFLSQASMKPTVLRAKRGGFQGRSQDTLGPVRSDVRGHAAQQAPSDESSERFFVVFVLSHVSSDVLFIILSVFTVFCWVRTKFAPNVHERRQTSKTESFCPPTSKPGASAGPKIEPERPRSSEKTRPKCPRGL